MTRNNTIRGVVLSVFTGLLFVSFCSPALATTQRPLSHNKLSLSTDSTSFKNVLRTKPLTFTFQKPIRLLVSQDTYRPSLSIQTAPEFRGQVEAEVIAKHISPSEVTSIEKAEQIQMKKVTNETPIKEVLSQPTVSLENPGGLNAEKLFEMVNSYRASRNLPAFQKDERSCQLAKERAPEIAQEIANGTMHKGMYDRNLPYWNTENIITMRTEEEALQWWLNDYIHKKQIEGPYMYSCTACSGNACAQEFTDFIAK